MQFEWININENSLCNYFLWWFLGVKYILYRFKRLNHNWVFKNKSVLCSCMYRCTSYFWANLNHNLMPNASQHYLIKFLPRGYNWQMIFRGRRQAAGGSQRWGRSYLRTEGVWLSDWLPNSRCQETGKKKKRIVFDTWSVTEQLQPIPAFRLSFTQFLYIIHKPTAQLQLASFFAPSLHPLCLGCLICASSCSPDDTAAGVVIAGISSSQSSQVPGQVSRNESNLLMRLTHWHTDACTLYTCSNKEKYNCFTDK